MSSDMERRALLSEPRLADPRRLEHSAFKVFSQNGEDGMLQEIFRRIGTRGKSFVEFGVSNGLECNTHFLFYNGWRGLWIEQDEGAGEKIRENFHTLIADGTLTFRRDAVSPGNIDAIIEGAGFTGAIDLLSVDIDGNDYYVLDAITVVQPSVIMVEYNASFPPPTDWVMPYQEGYRWDESMFFGASLTAWVRVLSGKGFVLVGTDLCGVNAFFVRAEFAGHFVEVNDTDRLYNPPRYWLGAGYPTGHRPQVNPVWRRRPTIAD